MIAKLPLQGFSKFFPRKTKEIVGRFVGFQGVAIGQGGSGGAIAARRNAQALDFAGLLESQRCESSIFCFIRIYGIESRQDFFDNQITPSAELAT